MRKYSWIFVAATALTLNACGDDPGPAPDGGAGRGGGGGGAAGRGGSGGTSGSTGRGGSGGSTGGSAAGSGGATGGSAAGSGGATGGSGGATGGSGGATGGSTAGSGGGGRGGSGGTAGGTGGSTAGSGGGTAGSTGGSTAGSGGATGGSTGSGGSAGSTGGSTAGSGGGTAGSTGGSTAGSGGATGGSTGSGGSAGSTGGSGTGTGGGTAGSTGGSGTGTGGSAGTGGGGGSVACTSASTCPGGDDTECQTKTCLSNICGMNFAPANTALASQTTGDCRRAVCDGLGGVMQAILDSDTPADEGNTCTDEICVSGSPQHPAEPARTPCSQNNGVMCNGSSATPACVTCVAPSDCSGTDTLCRQRVCGNQGTCGFANAAAGTDAEPDTTGNCRKAVCDASGGVTWAALDTDLPGEDGNPCTDAACSGGTASQNPKADGAACTGPNGGAVCFSSSCVQCIAANHCPGADTLCRTRTCLADHTCSGNNAAAGTAAEPDATGNCKKDQCDGNGGKVAVNDDTDKLVDGDACTADLCTNGVPSNPDLPRGTICQADGSKACDAAGACNTITFRVVRVGPGSPTPALSSATAPAFIEERRADGMLLSTIALPTVASGANRPLTLVGNSTSEAALSLSADGRYLVLAGYAVDTGSSDPTAATVSPATANRVVGRVDIAGVVNTTTRFTQACAGDNVRSAVSTDGDDFWIAGGSGGTPTTGGVWYNTLGANGGEIRILSTPNQGRGLRIFDNKLFGTSNTAPYINVFQIGTDTPPTSAATATSLSGMASGGTPFSFVMFDLAPPAGLDTIYLADAAAGVQKWTLSGTTWSVATTMNITGNAGFRHIAGFVTAAAGGSPQAVTLMAATAEATNRLVTFVDTGVGAPASQVVGTAGGNTVFRGISLSPHFPAP